MDELSKQNVAEESTAQNATSEENAENKNQEKTENLLSTPTVSEEEGQVQEHTEANAKMSEMAKEKLICPRCGKAFTPEEKNCPYCGMKNDLKLCKVCGATIAKSAKRCPKCGAENKQTIIYKGILLGLVLLIIASVIGGIKTKIDVSPTPTPTHSVEPTKNPTPTPTTENEGKGEAAVQTPTPDPDAVITITDGYEITVDAKDKPVLGTWEAYSYYDSSSGEVTLTEESPEDLYLKIKINCNNTGRMYTKKDSELYHGFDWTYIGTMDDGTDDGARVYSTLDAGKTQAQFYYVDKDSDLGKVNGGMLALRYEGILIFFEKVEK